jgi:hypothetical protein
VFQKDEFRSASCEPLGAVLRSLGCYGPIARPCAGRRIVLRARLARAKRFGLGFDFSDSRPNSQAKPSFGKDDEVRYQFCFGATFIILHSRSHPRA